MVVVQQKLLIALALQMFKKYELKIFLITRIIEYFFGHFQVVDLQFQNNFNVSLKLEIFICLRLSLLTKKHQMS